MERDPLESTEEEDPENLIVKINLKEIDRLHYHVRAIETECHIVPQGSMKLNHKHEVQRNEGFHGLCNEECFSLKCYSHFRNVQNATKKAELEADDAIFNRAFLDDVEGDLPKGCWTL
jgi:radial spoke head protein 9